jgi:vacuolar protein sorting-associated protein IST1
MTIQRLRMLQTKSTAISKQQRRHMAELLTASKLESARIRVENIIRSDIETELHEYLELYCELLLARISILEALPTVGSNVSQIALEAKGESVEKSEVDPGLDEAVRAIVFAAPKVDVKEMNMARTLLIEKFGKDFGTECSAGTGVPDRVLKRLRVETPRVELVDAYLREIARTYGVSFPGDRAAVEEEPPAYDDQDVDEDGDGGEKDKELEEPSKAEQLAGASPPRDSIGKPAPVQVVPPSPSTDNVSPSVRIPGGTVRKSSGGIVTTKGKEKKEEAGGPGGKIPDVDELQKRFAALKKV